MVPGCTMFPTAAVIHAYRTVGTGAQRRGDFLSDGRGNQYIRRGKWDLAVKNPPEKKKAQVTLYCHHV